jgi:hypothetical protein
MDQRNHMKTRTYFELSRNENKHRINICGMPRGVHITLKCFITKWEKSKINDLSFQISRFKKK